MSLPDGVLGESVAVSYEVWLTNRGGNSGTWNRVFSFCYYFENNDNYKSISLLQYDGTSKLGITTLGAGEYIGWISEVEFNNLTRAHVVLLVISKESEPLLYVNGKREMLIKCPLGSNYSDPNALIDSGKQNWIGKSLGNNQGFVGSVHELRIWSGILTEQEIISHYNAHVLAALQELQDLQGKVNALNISARAEANQLAG